MQGIKSFSEERWDLRYVLVDAARMFHACCTRRIAHVKPYYQRHYGAGTTPLE